MRILIDTNILFSATGNKDFLCLDMEHPKCMTVVQFFESESVIE